MKLCSLLLLAAFAVFAQAPTIIIGPHYASAVPTVAQGKPSRATIAGTPVLGFVAGPNALDLRAIVGTASAARLGDAVSVPETAKHLYLSPRQRYALVEQDGSLAIWRLGGAEPRNTLTPIAITASHPDLVAFSPRGEAVALYSRSSGRLQIIVGLPMKPSVISEIPAAAVGDASGFALSDDAKAIIAVSPDSNALFVFNSSAWHSLPTGYMPSAWSFLPNTHDLVISDPTQNVVALLSNVDEPGPAVHIIAQGIGPNFVAAAKGGDIVILADSKSGTIWSVEPKTMVLRQLSSGMRIDSLALLRDGHTALLSVSPTLSLFQVPSAAGY
ncbi:MAG TPA: hypothetical protein VFA65_14470 [Bryobacteraceae bacterium]|nr:hypothetical protein [Bryobacteraceae bacterium]